MFRYKCSFKFLHVVDYEQYVKNINVSPFKQYENEELCHNFCLSIDYVCAFVVEWVTKGWIISQTNFISNISKAPNYLFDGFAELISVHMHLIIIELKIINTIIIVNFDSMGFHLKTNWLSEEWPIDLIWSMSPLGFSNVWLSTSQTCSLKMVPLCVHLSWTEYRLSLLGANTMLILILWDSISKPIGYVRSDSSTLYGIWVPLVFQM